MKILNISSRYKQENLRQPSILLCLLLDLLGYASYSIPLLGEVADLVWAPVSSIIFFILFGGWKGAMGGVFNFIEEILPGTDFLPSFTIMWFLRRTQNIRRVKTTPRPSSRWQL